MSVCKAMQKTHTNKAVNLLHTMESESSLRGATCWCVVLCCIDFCGAVCVVFCVVLCCVMLCCVVLCFVVCCVVLFRFA